MIKSYEELMKEFEEYLDISTTSALRTKDKYKGCLRLFLLDHHSDWESAEVINTWLVNRAKRSNSYLYKYAIRHFLMSQGRKDIIMDLAKVKRPTRQKVFRYVQKETLQKMLNHLPAKFRKWAFLQVKTGARIGTVLTLRAENIDYNLHEKLIYIKAGFNKTQTKGGKELNLRLSKKYEPVLKSWTHKNYGFIFIDKKCEHMTEKELNNYLDNQRKYYDNELKKVGKLFEIEDFSSHYLRHLFSDYFLKSGGDPIYLKEILGHSRIDTTMNYVSISDQLADQAMLNMED